MGQRTRRNEALDSQTIALDGAGIVECWVNPRSPTVHTWLHVLSRSTKGRSSGKCPLKKITAQFMRVRSAKKAGVAAVRKWAGNRNRIIYLEDTRLPEIIHFQDADAVSHHPDWRAKSADQPIGRWMTAKGEAL